MQQKRGFFAPKPQPIDCDASAFLLKNGKLTDPKDVVFFNNLRHESGTVQHMGDNLTGAGEGDDEQIMVDLAKIPSSKCVYPPGRCKQKYRDVQIQLDR